MIPGGLWTYGLLAALAIALVVAAFTDIRWRRIGNRLNAAVALGAPFFWWSTALPLWPGAAFQLAFAGIMLLLLAALFAIGGMGGGDVKLLTALALWLPWEPFLKLLVMMALLGGVLTAVLACWTRLAGNKAKLEIPYGVAIASAGLWVIASSYGPAGSWR
jgi:prepilin peptidase CpaA